VPGSGAGVEDEGLVDPSFLCPGRACEGTPARAGDARANEEIGEVFADQPLAEADWQTAMSALAPLFDVPGGNRASVVAAFMLGAIACEALGDPDARRP
jgi:hypothetical protein